MIRSSRFAGRRAGSLLAVLALVAGLLTVTSTVTPAPTANAASVSVGTISAQMANQRGVDNGTSGNCITYLPTSGSGSSTTSSALVSNTATGLPNQALTAHGRSGSRCPSTLSTDDQSALGFRPSTVTSATDGTPFLIGGMTHYNNPIYADDRYYKGELRTVLGGFATPNTLTFNWTMDETPNTGSGCCNDITTFDNQISDVTLTQGGLTYKLVILGFVPNSAATTCPPTPSGTPVNQFSTVEGAQTSACLYAELQQVRSLRIVKNVVGSPSGSPSFSYNSTSTLTGSAWANTTFSLGSGGSVERTLLSGNTVTVTEGDPGDDRWSLTGLTCQQYNAAGVLVDMPNTTNLAQRRVSLSPVPAPDYARNPVVICTFTNTYTPRSTLTLVKQVQGNVVSPTLWTLTATGTASPTTGTTISGPSGSAAVTNQRIIAGSYRLTERGTGAAETGFVQVGAWACEAGGTDYLVTDGVVTLPDLPAGTAVTCTAVNRQSTGSLRITKIVDDPNGGYTGGPGKTFAGTYNCGTGYTGSYSTLTTNTPVTVAGIPVGRSCTVTETAPTGGLLNASFAWGTPSFSAQPVTISDGGTATVTITNTVVQKFGSFALTKTISGPGGYTGGVDRVFPVGYSCTLTNGPTNSGTLNLTPAGPVSPTSSIPAGSVCTFTETLTPQDGDFGDPSYVWTGSSINPTSVTIGDNTTAGVSVTNTYTRQSGQLILVKRVVGDGYIGSGDVFEIRYNCGVVAGSVFLADGGSTQVPVPAGNTCGVAEVPPSGTLLDAAHTWGTPTINDDAGNLTNQATIPADASARLTVSNPTVAVFGKVSVTKNVSGETGGVLAAASFDITVSCDDVNAYTNTFTLGVNASGTTPNLPVGTTCSFTEATPTDGLVDSSYAWGPPVLPDPVTITAANQVVTATVTNPVSRVRGALEITKRLVDPSGEVDAGRTYTIGYSCTYGSDDPVAGTVELTDGGSSIIEDLLLNSRCAVLEDPNTLNTAPVPNDPSWVWLPPAYDPGTSVVVDSADAPASVTVTNTTDQLTGTFQLTKSVVGQGKALGYVPDSTFTFSVECDNGYRDTAVIADGQSWQPTATIPQGTECTITETGKPDPSSAAYGWDDVVFTVDRTNPGSSPGASFTVGATPIQINATNPITPRFGTLEVTKSVTGQTDGLAPGASFQFSVNCGPGNLFVVTLADLEDGTQTESIPNIPVGSTCTVSEFPPDPAGLVDASYAWADAEYTPADATVTIDEQGQTVGITVTDPIVRVTVPVTVVKTLTGGQGVIDPARTYPITWSCTYGGGTVASATVDAVVDPNGVVVDDDVPVTSQCTATEGDLGAPSADPAYRWLTPEITGTTLTQAGPNVVTVANSLTRDNGSVLVRKRVTGATAGYPDAGDPDSGDFTLHGSCAVPADPSIPPRFASGTIGDTGEVEISPVSIGWTCSGTEDTPGQDLLLDSSYAWGTPVLTWGPTTDTEPPAPTPENTGPFVLTRETPTVAFWAVNPIVRVSSTFRITKTVVDPFGALVEGTEFSGSYTCQYGNDDPITGNWTLQNGQTFTGPSVYLNSVCTVTENPLGTTGLPNGSFAWATPSIGGPATVVPGGTATVAVTNTVTRLYGGLEVAKTLTGETAGVKPGTTYTGVWTCSLGDQTWSDRWTVGAGASVTVFTAADAKVPATAVCSVVEDTPSADALVDGSYAWGDRTYDPASVTLVDGQTGRLGVTNRVQRVYSSFEVAKAITGPVQQDGLVPTGRQFTGTWSCQYGADAPVTGSWTASVATPWVQPGILVGSTCTVTGETPPGAGGQPVTNDSSYVWSGTPDLGGTATVTPPTAANETVLVNNPTDRIFGRFYITKSVSGSTDGITGPEPFPMTYSCQPGDGPAITGDISLSAGGRVDVGPDDGDDIRVNIPVGSVCTLTEPLNTMPPLEDGAWSWGEPTFTVVGDIPTAGLVTQACVAPPAGDPQVTPCLGFPARSVTVTIPRPQEDYPEPPTVGLAIDNPALRSFGAYSVSKSSDPEAGSVVLPGQTITYSVTVDSTGDVPVHDVVVTDDLSAVLPSATLDPVSAPDGTSAAVTGTNLVWTVGDLPAAGDDGARLTLTYQATVNPGAVGATIKNLVTATGDVPPEECDPCTTEHTTPLPPTITKTPAGLPVFDATTGTWTVPYSITVTNPNPGDAVPYTLTDNIAFPTDVPIVSASVTSAPDGVTLFDPAWNGSDQTTIAADVTLPGGATHEYRVAVVATVPTTLDSTLLECAATGSGGGSGLFNLAAVSSMGTSSSADACDPIPVMLVVGKQWVIDGVAYADGDQPAGYAATPTIGGVEAAWGTVYVGFAPGTVVDVQENATVPDGCATSASGTGEVTLTAPLTSVTVTNVVDCAGPPPTTTPTTPAPTTTVTTLTTAYPPGPGPTPPLPNTGFSTEPFVFWGLGLLLAGALLLFGARRRWHRPPG